MAFVVHHVTATQKGKEMAIRQSLSWHHLYPAPKVAAVSLMGLYVWSSLRTIKSSLFSQYLSLIKSVIHDSTQQKPSVVCGQVGCVLDLKREIKLMN